MKRNRILSVFLLLCVLLALLTPAAPALAAPEGPTIVTTLTDNSVQKGSRKTFDVWARNSAGEKIRAAVSLNGEKLSPVWEDNEKASYTLLFTKEGENLVTVSASSDGGKKKQITYHIYYQKAQPGETIGTATWSVELFGTGSGYLIYPVRMEIREGETSAEQLLRLLRENGFTGYYSGTPKAAFYLGYIADGDAGAQQYNGYQRSAAPAVPGKLNLTPAIPAVLYPHLSSTMSFFDEKDYEKNWTGYIGEFVITNGSGWMYSVNNVFPNVGFSDTYLSDGDVVRVQFTLGYGADIGGYGAMGSGRWDEEGQVTGGFFPVADKDGLTVAICRARERNLFSAANVANAYEAALTAAYTLDAPQSAVDAAAEALDAALSAPDAPTQAAQPTPAGKPKPTQEATPTPAGKPEPTPTAMPTPAGKPKPTQAAMPTPAGKPEPTPTAMPTPAGKPEPTPTAQPTPTGKPELTPTPTEGAKPVPTGPVKPPSAQEDPFLAVAGEIIAWKKADNGAGEDGWLLNEVFLEQAGFTPGDWYPIGLGRLGVRDNDEGYLAVIRDRVQERYAQPGKLSAAKATEWHRISLAILAMGGDPTCVGEDADGLPINLIADGTYDRGKTASLGRQGINGWIWGLIALDSMRYPVPRGASDTRESIITEILKNQLPDGGFALGGSAADPDITAMAVQALSPYYNEETTYTYTLRASETEVTGTVRDAVEEAVSCLSALQLPTGDFKSWNTENVESTCQVTVALCCLGIDPLRDARFIKNGNTLWDGILRYRMEDGGFVHSFSYDPDNPTARPGESNTMAGEQVLYTMAALWRQEMGMRTLYDFREEQSPELKARIASLEEEIAAVDEGTDAGKLETLLGQYFSIPEEERCYVYHYARLSDAAERAGLDIGRIEGSTQVTEERTEDLSKPEEKTVFTQADQAAVNALPERLTTEQYVTVTTLLEKLERAGQFEGKEQYRKRLTDAKAQIAAIQAEIDALNQQIKEKLYPYEDRTIRDKEMVDALYVRYLALSEYDRGRIEGFGDLLKTKTKIDNLLRAVYISVGLVLTAAVLAVWVTVHIRKRRRRRQDAMEELAAQYEEEG